MNNSSTNVTLEVNETLYSYIKHPISSKFLFPVKIENLVHGNHSVFGKVKVCM